MTTTIENTRELPPGNMRAYAVQDEEHAREIAQGQTAYLFKQTDTAWYVFVPVERSEG